MSELDELELTEGEAWANRHIRDALNSLQEIDGERLICNENELFQAINVLQGFLKQHVLHRVMPYDFSNWYGKSSYE